VGPGGLLAIPDLKKDFFLIAKWCRLVVFVWVNYNDLTAPSLESWLVLEIIPTWPQDSGSVSEIFFSQINGVYPKMDGLAITLSNG
jgi:hypothetical protein